MSVTVASLSNQERLARVQAQIKPNAVGVYFGIETAPWRADTFVSDTLAHFGSHLPDYVIVKCGEWGIEWYDGTFPAIRAGFLARGVGCAPYIFARPQTTSADQQLAAKLAREAGIVILDCEEQWANDLGALPAFVAGVRHGAGDAPVIIVSGYGDPKTAVPGWDFRCLVAADAYQPQWYFGVWDIYRTSGWQAAIDWGDGQVAQQMVAANLGADYPVQPALGLQGVNFADIEPASHYLANWKAGLSIWEFQICSPSALDAARTGLGSTAPRPPNPNPVPPPVKKTYVVVEGDDLFTIAENFNTTWQVLYSLNKSIIGPNPNLIHPGQVLVLP